MVYLTHEQEGAAREQLEKFLRNLQQGLRFLRGNSLLRVCRPKEFRQGLLLILCLGRMLEHSLAITSKVLAVMDRCSHVVGVNQLL
jgi:hypothetical protein